MTYTARYKETPMRVTTLRHKLKKGRFGGFWGRRAYLTASFPLACIIVPPSAVDLVEMY